MAKNQKTQKPEEQAPKAEEKPRTEEAAPAVGASIKNRWFAPIIAEMIQNIVLLFLVTLGLRKPNQSGDQKQPGEAPERQLPIWILRAFPNLSRDDDDEYSQLKDSHPSPEARAAEEKFVEDMIKENIYDHYGYIVNLVGLRRRFMEQTKNPSPISKPPERVSFEKLTINDSAKAFISELLDEKVIGDTADGTVYERQKKRALRRNLLPKIHVLKKFRIEILIGMFMIPWAVIQFIIWILG